MNNLQKYIHVSKYARWIEKENQRETWEETVERYINFWHDKKIPIKETLNELKQAIINLEVMPSMRSLMTAGKSLERDNMAGFNCTGIAVTHQAVFSEILYILSCGAGVGFSVERQHIAKLPIIAEEIFPSESVVHVRDSKIGWASALKELIASLYNGTCPQWNLDKIRPAGARLKTFGGRASGPEPLNRLFKRIVHIFNNATGRKLNSIECHDIICFIAETIIVGGVRRSACLSLSNLTDDRMRRAKDGMWWDTSPQRALANNSVAYTEKPDLSAFAKEWRTLYKSKSGERGIVNKVYIENICKDQKRSENYKGSYLLNPCVEIILRDTGECCNLSSIIIRNDSTYNDILKRAEQATILGTLQATLTNFRFVRKVWKDNCEEERLLGVSLNGIMDNPIFSGKATENEIIAWTGNNKINTLATVLQSIRQIVHITNKKYAKIFGINAAKASTCIKPEGTTSLLVGCSSGIHPRYSKYYKRRVRQDNKDPLTHLMIAQGIENVPEGDKTVFSFYVKSPETSVKQQDLGAIGQLELWKTYQTYWADHNVSQSIYYTDSEYFIVADWIWKNWDMICGLSFFPIDDNIYENAPLEAITKDEYLAGMKTLKNLDFLQLPNFENTDSTNINQAGASCSGGQCDLAIEL